MDIRVYVGNPRITDYSFTVANYIMDNNCPRASMEELYRYHLSLCEGPDALYPMSNWQAHRLCLMSAVAFRMNDATKLKKCESLSTQWITVSDCKCCTAGSQDFHYRDSCEYVVYGWWALAWSFVYLQKATKKAYKPLFARYLEWIRNYETGKMSHVEFVNSKNMPADLSKPNYKKPFNPAYHQNFMRVYNLLTR